MYTITLLQKYTEQNSINDGSVRKYCRLAFEKIQ